MKQTCAIVANPAARRASEKKFALAAALLEKAGFKVSIYLTEKKGHGTELARKALSEGAGLVVAAGGDGTFNEVANALAGTGVPMGLLPMGTTNVLAKELRYPEDVRGAVKRILSGNVHDAHLGRLNFPDGTERRYFLMAGVGFDAWAVYNVDKKLKKYSGKAAYILSGLKNLLRWNPEPLKIRLDGEEYRAASAIICKGASYGGYMKAAPHASIMDPTLYAVLMRKKGRLSVLKYTAGILIGIHTRFRDVVYRECNKVEIASPAHVQADGDYIGKSPVVIDISPEMLRLIF